MHTIKTLFATIILGSLTFFLFVIGLGFMVFMLVAMLIAGLFVKPQTKNAWRQQWSQQWTQRKQFGKKNHNSQVIDGQYTVVEPHWKKPHNPQNINEDKSWKFY